MKMSHKTQAANHYICLVCQNFLQQDLPGIETFDKLDSKAIGMCTVPHRWKVSENTFQDLESIVISTAKQLEHKVFQNICTNPQNNKQQTK